MSLKLTALFSAAVVLAINRTDPPAGCITVAKSGGHFNAIQAAINSLSTTTQSSQCIFIGPGAYTEQVLVPPRAGKLIVYGSTSNTDGYEGNQVTITASRSQADGISNDETATLRVKATDFRMYNIDVNNGHGPGSQAVALSAYANSGYYGCAFTGFQDTLLANEGVQFFARCVIRGATDFIFGQHSPAWFERCDIRVLAAKTGYITASGRSSSSDPNYYVFNRCDVAAATGNSVSSGAYYLGRPWSQNARVVFQHTSMSSVINPAGWHVWNSGDERTSNVQFGEFANSGPGSAGTRAKFAIKLGAAVSAESILGSDYSKQGYFDSNFMS